MLVLKTVWKLCLIYIQADDVEVFVSFLTYFVIFFFIQFVIYYKRVMDIVRDVKCVV